MAILKVLNQNGEWEVAETPAAVKYTEQNLTDAQKAQVKANLGIGEDDVDTRYDYSFGRTSTGKTGVYRQLMARQADGTYSKADGAEGSLMYVTDLDDAVREFDYTTSFNWAQFLGEPTFIKVNFPEGKEFYLYKTDADGNVTPGDVITPKTLFLNLSTEIGDDYKILHLETVVNGRPYKSAMYFNKDTNAVVMSSSTMSPVPDSYSKTAVDTKLKSKIAIYNNVKPSTFKWWEAINYALGNTTINFNNVQTGTFQLNLASNCSFTGFERFGNNHNEGDKLTSALVNFTVSYYGGGSHELVLSIEHNGDVYKSVLFASYPGTGTEFGNYGFNIPDNIPFTKVAPTAMTNDEIDAICGVTILDASSGEVTF